jgi:hypothetical protein
VLKFAGIASAAEDLPFPSGPASAAEPKEGAEVH